MIESNTPIHLWQFLYEYTSKILSFYDTGRLDFQGQNIYETVMHYKPDISKYALFYGSSGCGSTMRDSKSSGYVGG